MWQRKRRRGAKREEREKEERVQRERREREKEQREEMKDRDVEQALHSFKKPFCLLFRAYITYSMCVDV
jgi:hypothetical protein